MTTPSARSMVATAFLIEGASVWAWKRSSGARSRTSMASTSKPSPPSQVPMNPVRRRVREPGDGLPESVAMRGMGGGYPLSLRPRIPPARRRRTAS